MDNNELNNDQLENSSANLQDYEIELPEKKNFFSSLLDKFKNKNQKLLHSGDSTKPRITNRSISSLWSVGNIRTALFNSLDKVRKVISGRVSSELPKNTLTAKVIGENSQDQKENTLNNDTIQETRVPPIIPVTKNPQSKGIINNAKTAKDVRIEIEVANIDTSAIKEKKSIEKENNKNEKEEKQPSETLPNNSNPASFSQPTQSIDSLDERE